MIVAPRAAAATALLGYFLAGAALAQSTAAAPAKETAGRNDKVCETITVTGSRLGKKRFCGTQAEWDDRRLRDRQEVEKAQRMPCVVNGTTCK